MFELLAAFVLDRIFGDPVYGWHPVRLIGGWITKTEKWLRSLFPRERTAGLIQAVLIPLATWVFVSFLCEAAFQIHPALKFSLTVYFLYSAIAVKDLKDEARRVYAAITKRKLEAARKNLSRLVGRDTENLDEEEVIRGTVEAVAESFVDGVWSPLFYAALGGAPLAMAYKAVNTLDSMVGLRTPKYREFGRAAAKLDEIANWIPARLSWFLIGLGTLLVNGRIREAWRVGLEHGSGTGLSNSAVPEAAFAGALGVQLGGTNFYQGEKVETPKLGYPMRTLESGHIREAYQLMSASAWFALGIAVLLRAAFLFFTARITQPL